jgi:hypothetical protein
MSRLSPRERAERKITKSGSDTINSLASDISEMLQVENAYLTAFTQTGEYRGASEYRLQYNGGSLYLKNIRNSYTNADTTLLLENDLRRKRDGYANALMNSSRILDALVKREAADNSSAVALGYNPYTIAKIGIVNSGTCNAGWPYLEIKVGHGTYCFTTGSLKYQILYAPEFIIPAHKVEDVGTNDHFIYDGRGYQLSTEQYPSCVTIACRESYRRS